MNKQTVDQYYEAYISCDPKFDGKFFIGVKTTGIYCRPICSAKSKRENVEFFMSYWEAEKAGYRPCLRCRPECAPDSPMWHGSSSIVKRALRAIEDGTISDLNETTFAKQFGVTSRHLRRLFHDELGKTPAQIHQLHRLNLARKFIVETRLPFVEIAYVAGFQSVRRFNTVVKERFCKTPTELRKLGSKKDENNAITLTLPYRPPLDWSRCLSFYEKHKIGDLESFSDNAYTRLFLYNNTVNKVVVTQDETRHQLVVVLQVQDIRAIAFTLHRIKNLFDLSLDPIYVTSSLQKQKRLRKWVKAWHGTRLIRCWDPFEAAISIILGQLISIKQATKLTAELIRLYGKQHRNSLTDTDVTFFPRPEQLVDNPLNELKITQVKKEAIRELSMQVASGEIHFSPYQVPQEFKEKLLRIRGIGKWTAEYTALRAIGDIDAFPSGDAFLAKCLDEKQLEMLSPWRGYVVSHLYKQGVAA